MSDIIKDPIQVNPNGAPQPANSNNTGLVIVIVIVVILFILPVIAMYGLGFFIVNVAEEAFNNYSHNSVSEYLSSDEIDTFQSIWDALYDEGQNAKGILKMDCDNLQEVSTRFTPGTIRDDVAEMPLYNYCEDGALHAKAELDQSNDELVFYFKTNQEVCTVIKLSQDFGYVNNFASGVGTGECTDLIDIPVLDMKVPTRNNDDKDDKDDKDDAPFTDNRVPSSPGTAKTNLT